MKSGQPYWKSIPAAVIYSISRCDRPWNPESDNDVYGKHSSPSENLPWVDVFYPRASGIRGLAENPLSN